MVAPMTPPRPSEDVTLILCMAGRYSRFHQAGYTTPKFLLPVQGETILAWIVRELAPQRVVCVTNVRDDAVRADVAREVAGAGQRPVELRATGDTDGQAATAILGAEEVVRLGWQGPILFHNVDTILRGRDLHALGRSLRGCDGVIDVFPHDSPTYSYCAVDGDRVTAIAEKKVIGPWATSGLYGFHDAATYLRHARTTPHRSKGEFYISDVYRTMLEAGCDLRVAPSRHEDTIVLGTPAEYEAWVAEHPG
jgi:dTDP-glucose pyrophosphorylase